MKKKFKRVLEAFSLEVIGDKMRVINEDKLEDINNEVLAEFRQVSSTKDKYNSVHEAWGVLEEEVYEVMLEVFKKDTKRKKEDLRKELVQVASCAMRFYHDLL